MPIHPVAQRQPFSWATLSIDDHLATADGVITDAHVRKYAFAVDDVSPWYLHDSPFGGRVAHPLMLADDLLRLTMLSYDVDSGTPAGLHTRADFTIHRPVHVGDRIALSCGNLARYVRNGRRYRRSGGEVRDEEGGTLLQVEVTTLMGDSLEGDVSLGAGCAEIEPAIATSADRSAALVEGASDGLAAGCRLPTLHKVPTLEQSVVFSGYTFAWATGGATEVRPSFHTDPAIARRNGFRDVVVQGLVSAAYLSELCAGFFKDVWFRGGRLIVVFRRTVFVRDRLRVSGLVRTVEEGETGRRVTLDLWCENDRAEVVAVGRATATVAARNRS